MSRRLGREFIVQSVWIRYLNRENSSDRYGLAGCSAAEESDRVSILLDFHQQNALTVCTKLLVLQWLFFTGSVL
jgi:hypothetical protein